MRLQAYAMMAP